MTKKSTITCGDCKKYNYEDDSCRNNKTGWRMYDEKGDGLFRPVKMTSKMQPCPYFISADTRYRRQYEFNL